MDKGPDQSPGSEKVDSSARELVCPFDLVDDLEDPPMEDSFDFLFLRFFLGMSGLTGDELPRAGSAVWWDALEAPSAKSLTGDWDPFEDLLDCLDFSGFSLVVDSIDEVVVAAAEEDCRLDDFGSSSRSRPGELWFISENKTCVK